MKPTGLSHLENLQTFEKLKNYFFKKLTEDQQNLLKIVDYFYIMPLK